MKATVATRELNSVGPDIDAAILQFMREQATKQKDQPCIPSLALIALAVLQQTGRKTSPYVIRKRLKELGREEEPETSTEKRKHEQAQTAAAGFGGDDRDFLKACGVAVDD